MNLERPTISRVASARHLAALLGVTERAVRMRAQREGWPCVHRRVKGGRCRLYSVSALPDEVRAALVRRTLCAPSGKSAAAGLQRGYQLAAETAAATAARRQSREQGLAAFHRLPAPRQKEAEARFEILKARNALIQSAGLPKKRGSQIFCREFVAGAIKLPDWVIDTAGRRAGKRSLSYASLNRWEKAYAVHGLAGLASGYSTRKICSIPAHMQTFIQAMLVEFPHASNTHVVDGLQARFAGQHQPSVAAVRRYIKRWKAEHRSLLLYMTNPDQWKSLHQFAAGSASEDVDRLNQLWEFDSTPTDVMLADGRHVLIGVIDVYSRRAKLIVAPTSRATAIAALTRRALLDWGVPELAKTDNGQDYVSHHLVQVFENLGIEQVLCPPFTPECKPHIERFFRTFAHHLVELLPGYIGHSVAERKAIEARRTFARQLMKREGQPVQVRMTAAELQVFCDRWVAAIYHQRPHEGLGGQSPAQAARAWTGQVYRINDEHALDVLLAAAPSDGGMRVIGKKGVKVEGGRYIAAEMAGHEGRRVHVRLDATDFGVVHCFLPGKDTPLGKFLCRAVDPQRKGIDRAELAVKVRDAQKKTLAKERRAFKQLAREVKVETINHEIMALAEKRLENVVELGRPYVDHTTAALDEAGRAADVARRADRTTQSIALIATQDQPASEVIDLATRKQARRLPVSVWDCYRLLVEERTNGQTLTANEKNWLADYDHFLLTGEKIGLVAAGFQPFSEREGAAVRSSSSV